MKLQLSVDLRKKTLEIQDKNVMALIDASTDTLVAHVYAINGRWDHANAIVDAFNRVYGK